MPILNCPIRAHAISAPNTVAIYLPDIQITYAQLDLLINETMVQLQRQSIGLNDPIAFCADNSLTLVVSLFATIRLGGIFCPISHRLTTLEIDNLLKRTGIHYLWHAGNVEIDGVTSVKLKHKKANYDENKTSNALKQPLDNIAINGDIPATIIFTSGSTGLPKAAVHSLNNHYYSALGAATVVPLTQNGCWLASLPINHIGGLAIIMRCFIQGASIALVDRKNLLTSFLQYPITHASLVPTQLYRLLGQYQQRESQDNTPNKNTLKLKYLLLGGAPISPNLLIQATTLGLNTFHSYGLTEMCSQVATSHAKKSSFSAPLPSRKWKLVNGEIALCGETLFLGYMSKGNIQSACLDGWFYSKDLAEMTPQGLKIIGRKDNMFIVGGENYQPETIEKIIIDCPLVENALIVAVKDDEFGAIPVAFIDWVGSAEITALKDYLAGKTSRIQIPKHFICWPTAAAETLKPNRKWYQQQAEQLILDNSQALEG